MHKKFMRRILFLLATVLMISCGSFSFATETTEYPEIPLDMLEYTGSEYDESGVEIETITIYGCDSSIQGNWTIPAEINGKPVTRIASDAFQYCEELTGIVIPKDVSTIGSEAFYSCSNLESVTIPSSVTSIGSKAFGWCEKIKVVNIESVESWLKIKMEDTYSNPLRDGYGGLYLNSGPLKEVVIPVGTTEIWDGAFYSCSDITSVTIPEGVTSIGSWAFYGCSFTNVTLPESLKEIGSYAFCYCDELISISIPKGITCVANSTFEDCAKLTEVILPEGITTIEGSAFYGCRSLKHINIPNSVRTLGTYLFTYCESLTSITIPEGVTSLGAWTFRDCKWLAEVNLPESLESIGIYAFWNCISLRSIDIPESVTSIGYCAFSDCINLSTIIIPEGMKTLEMGIFSGCKKLTSVVVPKNITVIEMNAFGGCTNLTNITIPKNVQSVENNVFKNCTALNTAVFQGDVATFGENVFSGCENVTIYIQAQAANLIKNLDLYGYNYKIGVSSSGKILASVLTVEFPDGKTTYDYTGKAIQPEMKVSFGKKALEKGVDYIVGYKNNVNAGTATVTITGIGDYGGSVSKNFIIKKASTSCAHDWKAATCTTAKTCTKCKVTEGKALGHKYGSWKTVTSATCTSAGKQQRTCSSCKHVDSKTIAKLGHNYSTAWTVDKKASVSAAGSKSHHCKRCDAKKDVTKIAKIKSIKLSKTSYVYNGSAKSPTVVIRNANGKTISSKNYTVTKAKGRTKVGKYSYKIVFKNECKGTKTLYFKVNPKAPTLKSVAAAKKGFTVKWSKVSKEATGYEIMYATNSKFTKNKKTVKATSYKTISKKVTKLKAKTKYYVKVRTYKTVNGVKYYSAWSKTKSVTTKK